MNQTITETEALQTTEHTILSGESSELSMQKSYSFAKLMSYYKCAMMEIETKFTVLNEEFSLQYDRQPICTIKTRLKTPISIHNKLIRYNFPLNLESVEENLNDIAGIRVVCSFLDDVYMLSDIFLKQDDVQLLAVKDYIKHPKENGYRSLHLIVAVPIFLQKEKRIMKAEIQFRTLAMDSWASLEHQIRYKKEITLDNNRSLELRHCADICAELDLRMNRLRTDIYPHQSDDEKTWNELQKVGIQLEKG